MPARKYHLHDGVTGSALAVRITPRSRKNEILGVLEDGTVKIRLTAPPVEGQANEALLRFLSDVLDIPVSRIEIIAGQTGRDKLITITDLDSSTVQKRIVEHIA